VPSCNLRRWTETRPRPPASAITTASILCERQSLLPDNFHTGFLPLAIPVEHARKLITHGLVLAGTPVAGLPAHITCPKAPLRIRQPTGLNFSTAAPTWTGVMRCYWMPERMPTGFSIHNSRANGPWDSLKRLPPRQDLRNARERDLLPPICRGPNPEVHKGGSENRMASPATQLSILAYQVRGGAHPHASVAGHALFLVGISRSVGEDYG